MPKRSKSKRKPDTGVQSAFLVLERVVDLAENNPGEAPRTDLAPIQKRRRRQASEARSTKSKRDD